LLFCDYLGRYRASSSPHLWLEKWKHVSGRDTRSIDHCARKKHCREFLGIEGCRDAPVPRCLPNARRPLSNRREQRSRKPRPLSTHVLAVASAFPEFPLHGFVSRGFALAKHAARAPKKSGGWCRANQQLPHGQLNQDQFEILSFSQCASPQEGTLTATMASRKDPRRPDLGMHSPKPSERFEQPADGNKQPFRTRNQRRRPKIQSSRPRWPRPCPWQRCFCAIAMLDGTATTCPWSSTVLLTSSACDRCSQHEEGPRPSPTIQPC
jgi:hypothetical protein